tara:strand:- start:22 stop:546 length:525 start_codon:yes stop_codon:yes gene_type:complete
MRVVECELINDCLAPKRVGNSVKKKGFRTGQRVRGTVSNIALTPDTQVLALKTKDGYLIPEPFLNILGEIKGNPSQKRSEPYYGAVEEVFDLEEKSENKSVSDVFQSLKASKIISSNSVKSKRLVNFALGGAVIGLVYAMLKGKNKLLLTAIGGVGGGVIGNYIGRKIIENDEE